MIKERYLTESEKQYIRNHAPFYSYDEIAFRMGRSKQSIASLVCKEKIRRFTPERSEEEVLELMQSLIRFCENTAINPLIKLAAKEKLKELSGIPKVNNFSLSYTIRNYYYEVCHA